MRAGEQQKKKPEQYCIKAKKSCRTPQNDL